MVAVRPVGLGILRHSRGFSKAAGIRGGSRHPSGEASQADAREAPLLGNTDMTGEFASLAGICML